MGMYLMRQIGSRGVYAIRSCGFHGVLTTASCPGTGTASNVLVRGIDGARRPGLLAFGFGWLASSFARHRRLSVDHHQAMTYRCAGIFPQRFRIRGNNG